VPDYDARPGYGCSARETPPESIDRLNKAAASAVKADFKKPA